MYEAEPSISATSSLRVPDRVSGKAILTFAIGVTVGLTLCMLFVVANNGRERIASYEEVTVSAALQEAQDIVTQTQGKADTTLLGETAEFSEKYDEPALAASMPTDSMEAWISWMNQHRHEERRFLEKRWDLAMGFIKSHELWRPEDVRAFLLAPREKFVRERNKGHEYDDTWLPIGYGATITDPDVVAMMTSALEIKPGEKVLEIGTGSGYQSSILCSLTKETYSIEIIKPLYIETDQLYRDLSSSYPAFNNITRKLGDGYFGWEKYAPFDKIIVTCAIDHIPPPLLRQLAPNGIMVLPMGPPNRQSIMQVVKKTEADGTVTLTRSDVYNGLGVHFIPFTNDAGTSYSASIPEDSKKPTGGN